MPPKTSVWGRSGDQFSCLQALFDADDAHAAPLAPPFDAALTPFQRLLVLRCLRPDKVLAGARAFVAATLGPRFVEPPPLDLAAAFGESGPATPLVFVLSAGADPLADVRRLAEERGFGAKFEVRICCLCRAARSLRHHAGRLID